MAQNQEAAAYSFTYNDGWPASFARYEVWAEVTKGSGRKILVAGGAGATLNGDGALLRIQPSPGWNDPEFRVIDDAAGGRGAKFPLFAWHYTLTWDRPVDFAEFDGNRFDKPAEFLEYLALRYSFLTSIQPNPLDFKLFRVGSPAEFPQSATMFVRLRTAMQDAWQYRQALDPNDPKDFVERVDEELMKPARYFMWAISPFIPITARTFGKHTRATLATAYLEMLRKIARDYKGLPLEKIMQAMERMLRGSVSHKMVISLQEDWPLAALLIFLAGLIPYGYGFGGMDEPPDANIYTMAINMVLAK